jgi:CubicO group peptidase (beta-lactamase class C family)
MNSIEIFINEELDRLINTGSVISPDIKDTSIKMLSRSKRLESSLFQLSSYLNDITRKLLSTNNGDVSTITGITSCIYLPSLDNSGEYKLKIMGGTTLRDKNILVNDDTLYDVASITKLYTLILLFKLEELGLIDLDAKIKDVNPDLSNLEDYTFNDLIRMHGVLRTKGNITLAANEEEAYKIFKSLYLFNNNRSKGTYTDFGAMAISDTLEKVISKELGINMTFDQIMDKYLLQPLNLNQTLFHPKGDNISGTGYSYIPVHDRKARVLGRAIGSAGLFVSSDDLVKLAKNIYTVKYINKDHIARLGEITFNGSQKGNLGIYVKHPGGLQTTFTPSFYSDGSFSHQGWTGSVATFDPNNLIHQNILVNAIYESDDKEKVIADKPVGYSYFMDGYLEELNKITILLYLVKKYYNKILHQVDDVDEVLRIK